MTQGELAKAVGVAPQTIFNYEIGERRVQVNKVAPLARALRVTAPDLVLLSPERQFKPSRLSPRLMLLAERLMNLTITQQRMVVRLINVLQVEKTIGRRRFKQASLGIALSDVVDLSPKRSQSTPSRNNTNDQLRRPAHRGPRCPPGRA